MKQIKLTQGLFALVDDEDFEEVSKHKWFAWKTPAMATFMARRNCPKGEHAYLHRFVMRAPEGKVCDHINHDTLDNQKSNLRICTQMQNMWNMKRFKNKESPLKGAFLDKRDGIWYSRIRVGNEIKNLGRFNTQEEAHEAYKEAAVIFHGEYAHF